MSSLAQVQSAPLAVRHKPKIQRVGFCGDHRAKRAWELRRLGLDLI